MTDESGRDAYDALDALNWSRLKLIERSPMHYKMGYGDDSSGFKLGTAAHMALLEPEKFASTYVVTPLRRDKRTKLWTDYEAEQTRQGKEILIQSEYDATIAIRDAVMKNPRARYYLTGGKAEQALTWKVGNIACKGRVDYLHPEATVDVKTTQSSHPREFGWSCVKFGYDGQAAWYSDGRRLAGLGDKPFVIIAVESSPPHIVTVFVVPAGVIEQGRERYLTNLARLDYCQQKNWWGGYSEAEEVELELPQRKQEEA